MKFCICFSDFESRRPPFKEEDQISVHTQVTNYNAATTTPVFFGKMHAKISVDTDPAEEFDASASHPACVGYGLVDRPEPHTPTPPPPPPDKNKCKTFLLDILITISLFI